MKTTQSFVSWSGQVRRLAALALAAGLSAGCIEPLAPGDFGNFRFFGEVRSEAGELPLPMLPPYTDREGYIYILEGDPLDGTRTQAIIGKPKGGWRSNATTCKTSRGDSFGAHGWVGHSDETAWYWSGYSLVSVNGPNGTCSEVVGRDTRTGTLIDYKGVFPWVKNTPTRSTIVTLVQSVNDAAPFTVVIDLSNEVFLSVEPFQPGDARDVTVLGVGANPETEEGYLLVRYRRGDQIFVEGRVVDSLGQTLSATPLEGGADLTEFAIQGFLQPSKSGLVAGFDGQGRIVYFDSTQGGFRPVTGMVPKGVHSYDGKIYVVGVTEALDAPMLAEIDGSGVIGEPRVWETSAKAAENLKGTIAVQNDRSSPRRPEEWESPVSVIGPFPFVHAHSPNLYADGVSGWIIGQPSYDVGGDRMYSVAFAAVGISYP